MVSTTASDLHWSKGAQCECELPRNNTLFNRTLFFTFLFILSIPKPYVKLKFTTGTSNQAAFSFKKKTAQPSNFCLKFFQ